MAEVSTNNTLSENVLILVKKHNAVVEAALYDYYVDSNMLEEVISSQAELIDGLRNLELEAEYIAEELEWKISSMTTSESLYNLDNDDIFEYLKRQGFFKGTKLIKVNNLADEMKLEEFCLKRLYPNLAEQRILLDI